MSTMIRWEPGRELPVLRDRMDRLFSEFLGRGWGNEEGLATGVWIPKVDVFETPENVVLKADLPEVKKDDVEISIQNNTDRKSTRLNSSHTDISRMPSSA